MLNIPNIIIPKASRTYVSKYCTVRFLCIFPFHVFFFFLPWYLLFYLSFFFNSSHQLLPIVVCASALTNHVGSTLEKYEIIFVSGGSSIIL